MLDHDNFYNRERSGYDELMSYYPKFWREILEMRANNKFAGYTLDKAAAAMEQVIRDQFFDTCSEDMVARYERFLNMDHADYAWEERRRLLKIAWYGMGKISVSKIVKSIREFYGEDLVVDASFTDHFEFIIHKLNSDPAIDGNIDSYLRKVIPAHIAFAVIYESPLESKLYAAGAMSVSEILEIRQVF